MLVKTAGVKFLVILINKMDDPTVEWNKDRYTESYRNLDIFITLSYSNWLSILFHTKFRFKGLSIIRDLSSEVIFIPLELQKISSLLYCTFFRSIFIDEKVKCL